MNQYCYSSIDRVLGWGARGPQSESQERRIFFHLNLFLRGNQPNGVGQGQQHQEQLK